MQVNQLTRCLNIDSTVCFLGGQPPNGLALLTQQTKHHHSARLKNKFEIYMTIDLEFNIITFIIQGLCIRIECGCLVIY